MNRNRSGNQQDGYNLDLNKERQILGRFLEWQGSTAEFHFEKEALEVLTSVERFNICTDTSFIKSSSRISNIAKKYKRASTFCCSSPPLYRILGAKHNMYCINTTYNKCSTLWISSGCWEEAGNSTILLCVKFLRTRPTTLYGHVRSSSTCNFINTWSKSNAHSWWAPSWIQDLNDWHTPHFILHSSHMNCL